MRLVYYPDSRLLQVCVEAPQESSQERARLAAKMWKIMRKNRGVGLASPQVGLNIRMFVWKHNGENQAIWNPMLTCVSGCMESTEGCISLPKVYVTLQRAISSILSGEGLNGKPLRFIGNAATTRIWQHEIDHLYGKLISDNMSLDEKNTNRDAMRTLLKNTVAE